MNRLAKLLWIPILLSAVYITDARAQDSKALLDSLARKMAWVDHRIASEQWAQFTSGRADSLDFFTRLKAGLLGDERYYETFSAARDNIRDEVTLRRIDIVLPLLLRHYLDTGELLAPPVRALTEFYASPWMRLGDEVVNRHEIDRILIQGNDVQRETAYRGLASPGEEVADQLAQVFRLRNQAAGRLGYNDYFSLYTKTAGIETTDYQAELNRIDSLTRPTYEQLVRELRSSFDLPPFEVWDFSSRFANTLNDAAAYFPAANQLDLLEITLDSTGFDIDDLPIYLSVSEQPGAVSGLEILTVNVPHDVRIVGWLRDGFDSYRELASTLGVALHLVSIDQEGYLLGGLHSPTWRQTTATLFARICRSPVWLRDFVGMPSNSITMFRRAQQGLDLFETRLQLLMARFEYEAYRNPNRDLNELYWDLFEDYILLPAHRDLQPWAGEEDLVREPLSFYHSLLGRAAGNQSWAYLTDYYRQPVGNTELAAFLKHNYFRFGSRYGWRDQLERATGRALDLRYLAE